MSFLKVVDTVITQEIKPKTTNTQNINLVAAIESLKEDDDKTAKGELLSDSEQSEYDVLYGDPLQRQTG